jgi:ubiquitin thioesterase protein OTUB1
MTLQTDTNEAATESISNPLTDSSCPTPRADLPPDLAQLTDEQISALTQEITDSYTRDVPLVGPFLPIRVLFEEFKNNEPFLRKLSGLAEKWPGFRRTARNGNCFYTAFAFAWFAGLQMRGEKRIHDEIAKVQETAKTLETAGISFLHKY